jgi:excisionase family DNA binding protein
MKNSVLTTTETAKLLGISVRTAQLLIEGGALPSWKTPGGHRRVHRADVEALMAQARSDVRPTSATLAQAPQRSTQDPRHLADQIVEADFPMAPSEGSRLQAVRRSGLVNSPAEIQFDRVTWLAAWGLKTPIALMTVLTPELQWFKSRQGLDMVETPRSWAFCNHTVLQQGIFEVRDLKEHPSFAHNPAVAKAPHFRFYAGAPVYDPDGFALGSICVIDFRPRQLDKNQKRTLLELAAIASDEVRLRGVLAKS